MSATLSKKVGKKKIGLLRSEQVQEFIKKHAISCSTHVSGTKTRDVVEATDSVCLGLHIKTDHTTLDTGPCCSARRVF